MIKLMDTLYYLDKDRCEIREKTVVGIYNIEKVKQDKEGYFFNAPSQLISSVFTDTLGDVVEGPIQKYSFIDMYETYSNIYADKNKAQEVLDGHIKYISIVKVRDEKIRKLQAEIDILENKDL